MRKAGVLLLPLVVACGLPLKQPHLDPSGVTAPDAAWARVLAARVDAEGRVDYDGLRKSPDDLLNFISYLSTFGPGTDPASFPTAASKLAYLINAYNAMALYEVADSDIRPADRRRFYARSTLLVDGSLVSLEDIESRLAALKDPLAFFAICGAAAGEPRLAPVPYSAAALEAQLELAARGFLNDPRNVQAQPRRRVVRLSQYLQERKAALRRGAASLLAYLNRYRDEKLAESDKVEYFPLDWSLNGRKP